MTNLWLAFLATAPAGDDVDYDEHHEHDHVDDHDDRDDRDGRTRFALTPVVGASSFVPPEGDSRQNLVVGGTGSVSFMTPGTFSVAGRVRGSYLGLVGQDQRGREWRAGFEAGPRVGTRPGVLGELSLTLLTGAEFVNDTYRFEPLGDEARVPRAWLVDIPFKARVVLAVLDAELGIAPSFFIDRQVGSSDRAPRPRPSREGFADELQMTSSVGLRLGDAFRVGLSHRTRWTGYGRLSVFGVLFGLDTL